MSGSLPAKGGEEVTEGARGRGKEELLRSRMEAPRVTRCSGKAKTLIFLRFFKVRSQKH